MKFFSLLVLCFSFCLNSFALNGSSKEKLLSMSDEQLWDLALSNKLGTCVISDARKCEKCACDYYVKSAQGGLPHGHGTGCVVAPSLDKKRDTCWSDPNVYDKYNDSKTPICTDDYVVNTANMLRIGIIRGLCDVSTLN